MIEYEGGFLFQYGNEVYFVYNYREIMKTKIPLNSNLVTDLKIRIYGGRGI